MHGFVVITILAYRYGLHLFCCKYSLYLKGFERSLRLRSMRNNIFHGSKSIDKWINYSEQINYCLIGMMKIADCMKIHNIVIPPPN